MATLAAVDPSACGRQLTKVYARCHEISAISAMPAARVPALQLPSPFCNFSSTAVLSVQGLMFNQRQRQTECMLRPSLIRKSLCPQETLDFFSNPNNAQGLDPSLPVPGLDSWDPTRFVDVSVPAPAHSWVAVVC